MDDKLKELLQGAKQAGASDDDLKKIIDMYIVDNPVKKKDSSDVSQMDSADIYKKFFDVTPKAEPTESVPTEEPDSLSGATIDSVDTEEVTDGVSGPTQEEVQEAFSHSSEGEILNIQDSALLKPSQSSLDKKYSLKAGLERAKAMVTELPNFINRGLAAVALSTEDLAKLNTLPEDQREFITNSIISSSPEPSTKLYGQISQLGAEKTNELLNMADEYRSKVTQYEGNIVDDINAARKGDMKRGGQAFDRVVNSALESLPAMAMAFIPYVGLPLVGAGTAALKQEEQEREGKPLDLKTYGNSLINGFAEYWFERYTVGLMGPINNVFKGARPAAVTSVKKLVGDVFKGMGVEGWSEGMTTLVQEGADSLYTGEFNLNTFLKDILDSVIVGGFVGAGMKGSQGLYNYTVYRSMTKDEQTMHDETVSSIDQLEETRTKENSKDIDNQINGLETELKDFKQNKIIEFEGLEYNDKKRVVKIAQEVDGINRILKDGDNLDINAKGKLIDNIVDLENEKQGILEKGKKTEEKPDIETFLEEKYGKDYTDEQITPTEFESLEKSRIETKEDIIKTKTPDHITERDTEWDAQVKEALPESKFENKEALEKEIKEGTWGMLTAENPNAKQVSDEKNIENNKKAEAWLKEKGYETDEIFGKYDNSERSFYVKDLSRKDAIAFAEEFGQVSIATNEGLVYQDGKIEPTESIETGGVYDNYYSTIKTKDGNVDIKVKYADGVERTGQQNEKFFTEKAAKESSKIPYKPVIKVNTKTPVAKAYDKFSAGGNFTNHISKMIAGFQEKQKQVVEAIVKDKTKKAPKRAEDKKQVREEPKKTDKGNKTATEKPPVSKLKDDKIKQASKDLAKKVRKVKFVKNISDLSKLQNDPLGVVKAVWDGAIEITAKTIEAGGTVAQAVNNGVKHLKESDWYKSLSDKSKKIAEDNFKTTLNKNVEKIQPVSKKPTEKVLTKKETLRIDTDAEVKKLLEEGKSEEDIIDSFETKAEKMMAQDYITRNKPVDIKEATKIVNESFEKAEREMKEKKESVNFLKKGLRKIAAKFWDRQYIPKMLLMKAGGRTVRNYMITAKGASGLARHNFDKAYDKIYKGKKSAEIKILDKIIQLRRFIAIDKNRKNKGMPDVVHPDFINGKISKAALEGIESEIGKEAFDDLNKRADHYFQEFSNLLNDMVDSGIISKEMRESFFGIDYQPRVFLEFLKSKEEETSIIERGAEETASLASPQIKRLESGSNTSLITDSEYLLGRSMSTRARSIAMNDTNKRLAQFIEEQSKVVEALKKKPKKTRLEKRTIKYFEELSKNVRINPIIGYTKKGEPKYKYKPKTGEKTQVYYNNGIRNQMIMRESFYDQYNDNLKSFWSSNDTREKASLLSGTGLVKTLATGNNPTFFITNSPRDLFFIATFSDVYGKNFISNLVKVSKDLVKGVQSIRKEDKIFNNFIKYGGMMDYLYKQGQFKGTNAINKFLTDKIGHSTREGFNRAASILTAKNLQMWSEMGFRVGVFNRFVKEQLKEFGAKDEQGLRDKYGDKAQGIIDDMYHNAVAAARNTTDFSQGGTFIKDLDAVLPYLNASVQGVRVGMEALHNRPIETTLRMSQAAAVMSAVPIGISLGLIALFRGGDNEPEEDKNLTGKELYLKALSGVSKYNRANYMTIFTGRRTEDGEFEFYRIAKPHYMTPLTSYAEGLQVEQMKKIVGDTSPNETMENVRFGLEKNISPFEFSITGNLSRSPIFKAAMTYSTGYDFYREQDLSHLRGKVPIPVEGFESKSVEDFYKKAGEYFNVSPARTKGAVESIITTPSTTPFVGMLYGSLDWIARDKDATEVSKSMFDVLKKSATGRVVKETSDFNRRVNFDKLFEKEFSKIEIENIKNKTKFRDLSKQLKDGEITDKELIEELYKVAKKSPFDAKRMGNVIISTVKNPSISAYVYEIKYSTPKQQALMLAELFGNGFVDEVKEMNKYNKRLRLELLVYADLNKETIFEYNKLIEGFKKK